MRVGVDAGTLVLYTGQRFTLHSRFKVANGSGTLINLQGRWIGYNVQYPNPNLPIAGMTVDFVRDSDNLTASLAPFVQVSTYNRLNDGVTFSPLLQIGRLVTWEFALTAEGGARPIDASGLWYEGFRGTIASVKWPQRYGRTASISCTDMGGLLQKSKSEAEYTYTAGTSIESAIQQVFSNNGHTVTFSAPVATGKVLANDYAPGLQKTAWEQAWALAQSIGWLGWFRYTGNSTLAYTLFEPSRSKTVPDQTISLIHDFTDFGIEESDIRNVGYLRYYDALGIQQTIGPMEDAASISTYGGIRRAFWISLTLESPVRDSTAGTAMLTAALADVADPDVVATVTLPPMVFADAANDLYDFPILDGRLFDVAQTGAPFAVEIKQTGDQPAESSLPIRGRPSAGSRTWTSKHSTGITSVGGGVLYDVRAPYAGVLTIDGTGGTSGAFATIQEAVDAAIARGATYADRWLLNMTAATLTGDVDLTGTSGIDLNGAGRDGTVIVGKVTSNTGNNLRWFKGISSTEAEGLEIVVVASTPYTALQGLDIRADKSWLGTTSALLVSGSGAAITAVIYADDCNFYGHNQFVNAAAIANAAKLGPGVNGAYVECMGGTYFKTSRGSGGTGLDLGLWSQASGFSYFDVNAGTPYRHAHSGSRAVEPRRNENASFPCTIGNFVFYADDTLGYVDGDAHASKASTAYVQMMRSGVVHHDLNVGRTLSLTDGTANHLLAGRSYFGTLSDVAYLERSGVGVLQTGAHFAAASLGYGAITFLTAAGVLQNVTANASILNAGTLAYARLPTGSGTWDAASGTVSLTGSLSASGGLTAAGAVTGLAFIPTTGGALAAGRIVRRADLGMVVYGSAGSSRCIAFLNDAGSSVMSVTPGSLMLRTDSDLLVGRNCLLGSANVGGGVGVLAMVNAPTAPTSTPAGGSVVWSTAGVLKTRSAFDALGGYYVGGVQSIGAAGEIVAALKGTGSPPGGTYAEGAIFVQYDP